MKSFFWLVSFISTTSFAAECSIEFYSKIYKINNSAVQIKDYVKKNSCPESTLFKLNKFIQNVDGVIHASIIKEELNNLHQDIDILPNKISVHALDNFLKDKLFSASELSLTQIKSLENKSAIALNETENLEVVCNNCSSLGEKNIQLIIKSPISATQKNFWLYGKLVTPVEVLKAKSNINFQQTSLNAADFSVEKIYTDKPEDYVVDLKNLNFYKPNRIILQNAYLTRMDILAVNLVNYGSPVKALYKINGLTLEKNFMPTRSARFNETVELNGAQNKKLYGKVVDFNKVEIEL